MAQKNRRFPGWVAWVVAIVVGGAIVAAQLVWVRAKVEDDLATRVKAVLLEAAKDSPDALAEWADFDVKAQGRDVVVSVFMSENTTSQDKTLVETLLKEAKIEGLRTFTVKLVPAEEDGEDVAEEPSSEPTQPAEPTQSPEPTLTPEPTATPSPTTSAAADPKIAALPAIEFPKGAVWWEDEAEAAILKWYRAVANGPADAVYEVQGHADANEDPAIAQRRADRVRNELIDRGISASRLTAKGYGSTQPGKNDAASRRVVLAVAG
ncbi:MAG: OmpA family protein [Micrococcales bacterium]|nr:OmpA family protein [Micrococcales bacterium]